MTDLSLIELFGKNTAFGSYVRTMAAAVRALGTDKFETALMSLLSDVVPIDHCAIFTYSERGQAGHLFTHSSMPPHDAERLARDYVERFHERDPNFAAMQQMGDTDYHGFSRRDLNADYDPAYQNHFFDRSGLIDKASSVGRIEDGQVYCNFYRMAGSQPYSDKDWAVLKDLLPLATALVAAHYDVAKARGQVHLDNGSEHIVRKSIVHNIISLEVEPFTALTDRERQVCERILLGYTTTGIGLDLDIAPTSVATYRKRAYAKLSISSQNELFALCFRATNR